MPERVRADRDSRTFGGDRFGTQTPLTEVPLTRREARMLEGTRAPAPPPAKRVRHAKRHRRSSLGRRLLSLGALVSAGGIAFGMSVPANAFLDPETLVEAMADQDAATVAAAPLASQRAQSLTVPEEVMPIAAERDTFGTLSYAEMLRLKYANVDYSFAATTGAIRWPFPHITTISDGWGDREGGFHKGVDFTPGGGAPIYAIADGIATVVDHGWGVYGTHVIVTHTINGQRVDSLYAHMQESSTPIVHGQTIKVGDFLGLVGDTGLAFGAHLHLEIHVDGVPVDPFAWLTANAV